MGDTPDGRSQKAVPDGEDVVSGHMAALGQVRCLLWQMFHLSPRYDLSLHLQPLLLLWGAWRLSLHGSHASMEDA
jgi:hypothetical protein